MPYTKYYVGGSAGTIYKRGNQYPDALYVGGEEVIVRRQGNLLTAPLFYAGRRRANLKLATFTTREVTALGG